MLRDGDLLDTLRCGWVSAVQAGDRAAHRSAIRHTPHAMCGICGIALNDPRATVQTSLVRRMCDTVVHRGPDDDGYFIDGPVGLGMRRLSIIDVEGGRQPMANEDGHVRLVFNGEIYNYRALRGDLAAQGHTFATESDTEAAVHAYEQYGEAFLDRLRGMFALALWDRRAETLLLAVDRFGIKPIYYAADGERFVFGSELKCLLAAGMGAGELDYGALAEYFTLGYIPAPNTVFHGARKLPAGHLLRWSRDGGVVVKQYWDLPPVAPCLERPVARTRRELREALRGSVRAHLVSDVPLGAFLSGGIDSSTIVALMSEVTAEPVKTFSIGFADRAHNELDMARLVAARYRTDHHEFTVEPETAEMLPKLVSHFDEPFADAAALPTYYVAKMARGHVKVALSGDGGDELFLGYTIFRGLEAARYAGMLPGWLRGALAAAPGMLPRTASPALNDRLARWTRRAADSSLAPEQAYRSKSTTVGLPALRGVLSPGLLSELERHNPYRAVDHALASYGATPGAHPLERFVYGTAKVGLASGMLVKIDRMSMANSLEVRVPFVDHVLAEFVATVPIEQRFPRWRLKGLLKDTMADVLPREVLRRPKHGFAVPLTAWFRGDLAAFAADILLSRAARARGFIEPAGVQALLHRHRAGADDLGSAIWSLLVFELWCRQTLDWAGARGG